MLHVEILILTASDALANLPNLTACMHTCCTVILASIGSAYFLFTGEWREYISQVFIFYSTCKICKNKNLKKISTYTIIQVKYNVHLVYLPYWKCIIPACMIRVKWSHHILRCSLILLPFMIHQLTCHGHT